LTLRVECSRHAASRWALVRSKRMVRATSVMAVGRGAQDLHRRAGCACQHNPSGRAVLGWAGEHAMGTQLMPWLAR
jgi:hypothetical protein